MNNSFFFRREIDLISDTYVKNFVTWFLDNKVGKWFWSSGASSSGKYHPSFAQGEGGLVRHTRAVVLVCYELLRMSSYSYMNEDYKDFAIAACLLHDTCKYGTENEENSDCYHEHGKLAALAVRQAWWEKYHDEAPELFCLAIRSHMGQCDVEDAEPEAGDEAALSDLVEHVAQPVRELDVIGVEPVAGAGAEEVGDADPKILAAEFFKRFRILELVVDERLA